MTTSVIAVIGAGNMGSSLLGGLTQHGHTVDNLWAADPSDEKLLALQNRFHVHTTTDNAKAVQMADVVIFAVKPQIFSQVASTLSSIIEQRKPLVISIAAGIRIPCIEDWLGKGIAIVRAMPNTPALVGCGATTLCANAFATPTEQHLAELILRAVGVTIWIEDERLMDTVTALSGSGPAYFFLVMEALQHAAQQLGLPPETARILTEQTALGAARMAIESGQSLASLRQQVTSPGGTTEKAISILEANNVQGIFMEALQAAKLRSEELAENMEKK